MKTVKLDILAFAAHPDDIELCAGGFLYKMAQKRYKVGAIDLTRGENGTFGTPLERKKEAEKASKILKFTVREILDFGDSRIEDDYENRLVIAEKIRFYRPKLVLLPYWQDQHPDHVTTSILGEKACFYAKLKKIKTSSKPHTPSMVLFYQLHEFTSPSFIVDISEEFNTKMKAIQAYKSQFKPKERKGFTEKIKIKAQFCGSLIQVKYGEAFISKTPLKITDPLTIYGI